MISNLNGGALRLPKCFDKNSKEFKDIYNFVTQYIIDYTKYNSEFSVRDMFGGENFNWCDLGFPIGKFYEYCYDRYVSEGYGYDEATNLAIKQAGIYVGMVVKHIVHRLPMTVYMRREGSFYRIVYKVIKPFNQNNNPRINPATKYVNLKGKKKISISNTYTACLDFTDYNEYYKDKKSWGKFDKIKDTVYIMC